MIDKLSLNQTGQETVATLTPMGLTFEACCTKGQSTVNEGIFQSAAEVKTCVTDRDAITT